MHTDPIPNRVFKRSHDGHQALVSRIARPEFTAERIAVLVQHHAHHHLLQVGTMIFRVPAPAEALAPRAFEVDRGGVEKTPGPNRRTGPGAARTTPPR
jgi:hypothetical protein